VELQQEVGIPGYGRESRNVHGFPVGPGSLSAVEDHQRLVHAVRTVGCCTGLGAGADTGSGNPARGVAPIDGF
jgi:hypothetical protein